jgi:hypothetical protein
MFARRISVKMHDKKRRLDWKAVDELRRFVFGGVREGTTRTSAAHSLNICPHRRPVIAKSDPMQCLICVQMSTDSIGMKGHKDGVVKSLRDQLQACIRIAPRNRLLEK